MQFIEEDTMREDGKIITFFAFVLQTAEHPHPHGAIGALGLFVEQNDSASATFSSTIFE